MYSVIIRALCSLAVGILLLIYPLEVQTGLILLIGALFVISGLYSVISYWRLRKSAAMAPVFPITGCASTLLGIWMLADSMFFVRSLMYALGALLIVAAIGQLVSVWHSRKVASVPLLLYLAPLALLLSGIYVVLYPERASELPFIVIGVSMIIYSVLEIFRILWVRRMVRILEAENAIEDAVVVEESASGQESSEIK